MRSNAKNKRKWRLAWRAHVGSFIPKGFNYIEEWSIHLPPRKTAARRDEKGVGVGRKRVEKTKRKRGKKREEEKVKNNKI